MKKTSFLAVLTIIYPEFVMGYNPTITDTGIRNHSYTVEQISADLYNTAITDYTNAPVFHVTENGVAAYYKWDAPDLTRYKTAVGENVFSVDAGSNGSVELPVFTDNPLTEKISYYYTTLSGTDNAVDNTGGADLGTIDGDFIYTDGVPGIVV